MDRHMASWEESRNFSDLVTFQRQQVIYISGWWALILVTFALIILTYILAVGIVLYSKIRYRGPYLSDETMLTDANTENMNTVLGSGSS